MNEFASTASETSGKLKARISFVGRLALSILLLILMLRQLKGGELLNRLSGADLDSVVYAALLFGVALWLAAVRWWLLVRVSIPAISLSRIAWLTLVGHFFGQILLGAIAGDVVKAAYLMSQARVSKAHVALSVALDRIVGLCVIVFMVATAFPFRMERLAMQPQLRWVLVCSALLVLFAGLFTALLLWRLSRSRGGRRPDGWRHRLEKGAVGEFAGALRSRPWAIAQSLLAAAVGHLCFFASAYCLARGLEIDLSWIDAILVMGAVVVITSIPISIGGHGVREGVLVLMFGALEIVPQGQPIIDICLAFSISFVAVNWMWALVAGAAYILAQFVPGQALNEE